MTLENFFVAGESKVKLPPKIHLADICTFLGALQFLSMIRRHYSISRCVHLYDADVADDDDVAEDNDRASSSTTTTMMMMMPTTSTTIWLPHFSRLNISKSCPSYIHRFQGKREGETDQILLIIDKYIDAFSRLGNSCEFDSSDMDTTEMLFCAW